MCDNMCVQCKSCTHYFLFKEKQYGRFYVQDI